MMRPTRTQPWSCIRIAAVLLIQLSLLMPSITRGIALPDRPLSADNNRGACREATPARFSHYPSPALTVAVAPLKASEVRTFGISQQETDYPLAIDALDEGDLACGAAAISLPRPRCSLLQPSAGTRLPDCPYAPPTPPPESTVRS